MSEGKKVYYYCAVPRCTNTSTKNPEKKFFSSPADVKRRRTWLKKMRRDPKDLSSKTTFFVCEDHFDLEADLKNFTAFKYGSYTKNALKSCAVPSNFHCQNVDEPTTQPRVSSLQRKQKKFVHEVLTQTPLCDDADHSPYEDESCDITTSSPLEPRSCTTSEKSTQTEPMKLPKQVKHYRSKYVQCDLLTCATPPSRKKKKLSVADVFGSESDEEMPEMVNDEEISSVESDELASDSESAESEVSLYSPSDNSLDTSFDSTDGNEEELWYIRRPREYTGIPKESFHIIDVLQKYIEYSPEEIFIVLVKIRKNYTNIDLGDRFKMNEKRIRTTFARTLPAIAEVMKHFIKWPTPSEIKTTLPIAFRRNFRDLQVIIDALEIEIQKPTDPVLQALTWSDYKKCNTMKYLVASAPNGQVIFISDGYGGRTSDIELTQRSGFLAKLPKGATVLADRGFKGVDAVLRGKGCKLVRPPSTKSGTKMTKAEVRQTKQIASIRIHIERAIRRLREFYLLKKNSCVHHDMLKYLDHCVIIASGITNLQPALIKYT